MSIYRLTIFCEASIDEIKKYTNSLKQHLEVIEKGLQLEANTEFEARNQACLKYKFLFPMDVYPSELSPDESIIQKNYENIWLDTNRVSCKKVEF